MSTLNTKFRTYTEIAEIKKNSSTPKNYRNYITKDEITWLNNIHSNIDKKWMNDAYQNLYKEENSEDYPEFYNTILDWVSERFRFILGEFNISSFSFCESLTPANQLDSAIHADIGNDKKIIGKTLLIPLKIEPELRTYTIVFDQHYYHFGAEYVGQIGNKQKFGSTVILPDNYHMIENFRPMRKFDRDVYFAHLTHKPYSNFYGLSVNEIIRWEIGNAIILDRTQLRCCDHYFNTNILSWFAVCTNQGEFNG